MKLYITYIIYYKILLHVRSTMHIYNISLHSIISLKVKANISICALTETCDKSFSACIGAIHSSNQ